MPSLFDTYLTRAALRLFQADAADESLRQFMSAHRCDERAAKLWLRRYLQGQAWAALAAGELGGFDSLSEVRALASDTAVGLVKPPREAQ